MHWSVRKKLLATLLIVCILIEPVCTKRGGGGGGFGRGSSGARSGGGFGRARTGGGTFGTGGGGYKSGAGGAASYPRGNNYGMGGSNTGGGGGLFGGSRQSNSRTGTYGTGGGGLFGGSSSHNRPRFNKGSGIGSMVRSNTFKNAIVGAAAGYLTYQAGKHLIRSAMSPMMWNNRPYYWGSNYYQQRPGNSMCRMPIDQNDQQFGNIYFNDHSRPREIVWGCSYNEVCCGYECCPAHNSYGGGGGGYFGGYNSGYRSFGFGSLLVLLLISCCACGLVYKMCNRTGGYQRGRADPPPQYNAY